jgi:hypothetical protein
VLPSSSSSLSGWLLFNSLSVVCIVLHLSHRCLFLYSQTPRGQNLVQFCRCYHMRLVRRYAVSTRNMVRSLLQGVSREGGEKNYHNTVRFIILYPMLSQNKSK